jgi:hypothetical protein
MTRRSVELTPCGCARVCFLIVFSILLAVHTEAVLPDLRVNRARLANTIEFRYRTFTNSSCAVAEGCVKATGRRRLLLFDCAIANVGNGDLVIGDPADRPDLFHFSPCHRHYHLNGLATYTLAKAAGSVVARAHKQGFCLRDDERYYATAKAAFPYVCSYQGITTGWQDVYDKALDCQWIDITGLRPGNYVLRITVNPAHVLRESNYDNNTVQVPIYVPKGSP